MNVTVLCLALAMVARTNLQLNLSPSELHVLGLLAPADYAAPMCFPWWTS